MLVPSRRLAPDGRSPEAGDIVLGWLTRVAVVLAIAGVALFDAISVGSTKASVADDGTYAAREASSTWDQTKDIQATYETAVRVAEEENADNKVPTKGFTVDQDGTVHLVVSRTAPTLVLYRWGKTATWADVSAHAEGRSVG